MSDLSEGLFGLLVLIFDIVAIFDIVTGPKDILKKFLWTLAIIVMPVLGVIIYYLFGRKDVQQKLNRE